MILLAAQDPKAIAKRGEDQQMAIVIHISWHQTQNPNRFAYDDEEKSIDHQFCKPSLFSIFDVSSSLKA
jgi:hypothetical protein